MLGNPYPSALNISGAGTNFLTINNGSFDPYYKAIYTWDGANDTYEYIGAETGTPSGYSTSGETHVQAGQGFFVLAYHTNAASFDFTPAMRSHQTGLDFKSTSSVNPWPGLELKVESGGISRHTLIVYNEDMTGGLDPSYDVGQLTEWPDVEIYTQLAQEDEGVGLTRQALPMADYEDNVIPVGLWLANGGEVTFSAFIVPLEGYKFMLEDRDTDTFTDLSSDSYTVTLPSETYGTGRFYIHAQKTTGTDPDEYEELDVRIWSFRKRVYILGDVSDQAVASVWNLSGQKIKEVNLRNRTFNKFSVPGITRGLHLIRVIDGNKMKTHKVWF